MGADSVIYVDDTTVIVTGDNLEELHTKATQILPTLKQFFASLNLELNWNKTVYMMFDENETNFELILDGTTIKKVKKTTFLGMELHNNLKWDAHKEKLEKKLNSGHFIMSQIAQTLYKTDVSKVYHATFHANLSYGTLLWANEKTNKSYVQIFFRKQKKAIKL